MQVLRLGFLAMLIAAVAMSGSFANDDLASMKAAMESMKSEMDVMRADMVAEREAIRSNAGGAPDGLRSANGNATIRIGGDFRVGYGIGWASGYRRQARDTVELNTGNFKSQQAGWAVNRAQLFFDIDLSCDTSAHIDLRLNGDGAFGGGGLALGGNILNQAYWSWKNVGGSGFGLKVGLMDVPFGMWANTDMGGYAFDSVDRALITKPFTMSALDQSSLIGGVPGIPGAPILFFDNGGVSNELTNLGIFSSYNWDDQVVLKAGIMAGGNSIGRTTQNNDMGLTYNNEQRNIGFVDHVITLGYNPCFIEGLHLEASYMGRFDEGRNELIGNNPFFAAPGTNPDDRGDTTYQPSFNFGVSYQAMNALKLYAEYVATVNPYYNNGYASALTLGFDYNVTEKITLGAGFDWYRLRLTGNQIYYTGAVLNPAIAGDASMNVYRFNVGGKYNFGNGLYFQAQYYHEMMKTVGIGNQNMKDADVILFQTGYTF